MKLVGIYLAALVGIAACGPALGQEAKVKLTLGHNAAAGNPKDEGAKYFAERVRERSGGRIEIQVAGSAQLGDDTANITGMRTGSIDLSANSQGALSTLIPEFGALGMPYLFDSLEHAWKVVDGPVGEELAKKADAKGLVLLGLMDNGIRHTSNSKRPIEKPEDLHGLKIRTPPDPVTVSIFRALGADTQQIKFSELYIALQQGVVDGQENPIMNVHSSKLYEVQKYISLTGHKYETTPLLMSKRTWSRLSEADREVIRVSATEALEYQRRLSKETEQKVTDEMPKLGIQINSPDRDLFRKASMPVIEEAYKSEIGGFVRKVVAEAQKAH
ncbi:MAG TPA: TRAP transporter substrate-binding protein [Azospirillum sp.]|nr:TRAP transporter substrate-binding protein [Azospirillum sp.]